MVFLVVKGTKYPDEFVVQAALEATCGTSATTSPSLTQTVCHIQNSRHLVRLMLLSASELLVELQSGTHTESNNESHRELVEKYAALIAQSSAQLKNTTTPVSYGDYDTIINALRELTCKLFPALCTHEEGTETAVQKLYAMHDDPELDEDTRLKVYHCRAILDQAWKAEELLAEDDTQVGLWFCGKLLEGPLAKYCGRNAKSRMTVKLSARTGPAPSGEPRMSYEAQRQLYEHVRLKRATFAALEESELRDRVVQRSRGAVVLPPTAMNDSGNAPGLTLSMDRLRNGPHRGRCEERLLNAEE